MLLNKVNSLVSKKKVWHSRYFNAMLFIHSVMVKKSLHEKLSLSFRRKNIFIEN
jgi:hypothetical protein